VKAPGDPEILGVLVCCFFLMEHRHKALFHKDNLSYIQAEGNTVKKSKYHCYSRFFRVNYTEIYLDSQATHNVLQNLFVCLPRRGHS